MVALALAAILVPATVPTPGSGAPCTRPTARSAIRSTRLRMKLLGDTATRVDPNSADQLVCFDFTRDGRRDLAVTLASGGTAGDIGFVVFRRTATGWRVALAREGYKLGIFRVGGDLVSSQPVYGKNYPNCCPTGGFDHLRFHWNGVRFVVARSWHTKSFRP